MLILQSYIREKARRLSRPRHCSKSVQPMPKAVYHSVFFCFEHTNCLRFDTGISCITCDISCITVRHVITRPLQHADRATLTTTIMNKYQTADLTDLLTTAEWTHVSRTDPQFSRPLMFTYVVFQLRIQTKHITTYHCRQFSLSKH